MLLFCIFAAKNTNTMVRFLSIAMLAMASHLSRATLVQAAAIIDDALMAIYDIDPKYYDDTISRLQSLTKSTA